MGMGATLVALCIDGPNAIVANVGDSRAYLLRGTSCEPITRDHSLGAEQALMNPGAPLPPNDGRFNIITRAIGVEAGVQPDLFVQGCPDIAQACASLIEAVKISGAQDNVTCLLVQA